jgi:hypothetical protein
MNDTLIITPETRVGAMLEKYPQLEELLLSSSPAFSKLQNPLLRKTVGKIATLRQVAQVGGLSLADLINRLRRAVGQEAGDFQQAGNTDRPAWMQMDHIRATLDARPMLAAGEHPLGKVLAMLKEWPEGAIFELLTPFAPAPLLDQVRQKGFEVYSETVEPELVKSYFYKSTRS